MVFGLSLHGVCRSALGAAFACALVGPAHAAPAFEYRAAGFSVAIELPLRMAPQSSLSNVVSVSGAQPAERLLVAVNPAGRWRAAFSLTLVPGFAAYDGAAGPVPADENAKALSAGPKTGSLVMSFRAPDGALGVQIRVGANGTVHFAYDRPEWIPGLIRRGSGVLPVSTTEYYASEGPATVPVPATAPLLLGALAALGLRARRKKS